MSMLVRVALGLACVVAWVWASAAFVHFFLGSLIDNWYGLPVFYTIALGALIAYILPIALIRGPDGRRYFD